jgi:LPXTG-site transpeptidase (sortase) family protein
MQLHQKSVLRNRHFRNVVMLFVFLSTVTILLVIFIFHDNNIAKVITETPAKQVVHETQPPVTIQVPLKLTIDSLAIDAVINPVGLTPEGDMDIDENPAQTAWYKLGPKPGEQGSAVIAGHYGWKNGIPSVFNDLNKLIKGDEISIYDKYGQTKTFVVSKTAVYAPDQDASNVFRSNDGKAHLNLVTCQGSWNASAHTYSERLIIFSDYVE